MSEKREGAKGDSERDVLVFRVSGHLGNPQRHAAQHDTRVLPDSGDTVVGKLGRVRRKDVLDDERRLRTGGTKQAKGVSSRRDGQDGLARAGQSWVVVQRRDEEME